MRRALHPHRRWEGSPALPPCTGHEEGELLGCPAACCGQGSSRAGITPPVSCQTGCPKARTTRGEAWGRARRELVDHAAPRGRLWSRQGAPSAPGQGRAGWTLGGAAGPHRTQRSSALAQLVLPDAREKVLREAPGPEPGGEELLLSPPEHGRGFSSPRLGERSTRTSFWEGPDTPGSSCKRPAHVLWGEDTRGGSCWTS